MPKETARRLSANQVAKTLTLSAARRRSELRIMAARINNDNLLGTPAGQRISFREDESYLGTPNTSYDTTGIEEDDDVILEDGPEKSKGTPIPETMEAVIQSIHSTLQRQELRMSNLQGFHEDTELKLANKIEESMKKIMGELPGIVGGIVDKKMGAYAKESSERMDAMQEEMDKNRKAFGEEIRILKESNKQSKTNTAPQASKRIDDMEKKLEDVRKEASKAVAKTCTEFEKARCSLLLSPIPYQRGATSPGQIKEVLKLSLIHI